FRDESLHQASRVGCRTLRHGRSVARFRILRYRSIMASRDETEFARAFERGEIRHEMFHHPEHVTIRTNFPPEPWRIYADAGQLGQVMLNLAVNARDAMPDGGTLTVEVRHFYADAGYIARHPAIPHGEYVVLVVSDSGTGIPLAIRE